MKQLQRMCTSNYSNIFVIEQYISDFDLNNFLVGGNRKCSRGIEVSQNVVHKRTIIVLEELLVILG